MNNKSLVAYLESALHEASVVSSRQGNPTAYLVLSSQITSLKELIDKED